MTLKVISQLYLGDESARLRFLREARAAASVRHPNVASVFHLGKSGENYFYAMEFLEGETIENLVRRTGRLEVKLALDIAAQVAAGLTAVHKKGLVHRDIKPSNIMVNFEDECAVTAKIIDLGLAKAVNKPGSQAAISIPGAFAGTPEFASPEQKKKGGGKKKKKKTSLPVMGNLATDNFLRLPVSLAVCEFRGANWQWPSSGSSDERLYAVSRSRLLSSVKLSGVRPGSENAAPGLSPKVLQARQPRGCCVGKPKYKCCYNRCLGWCWEVDTRQLLARRDGG